MLRVASHRLEPGADLPSKEGEAPELSSIAILGRFKLHGEFVNQMAAQLLDVLNA